ncbi:MAG: hypothetical protein BGO14_11055 [Chlamydiales bacterium 38-26]|nr:hypothetical protein [Chlamydiales bacterium]OJV11488.1 MAG: hypothetical protein BGO14_11055 [Chlamydiales bacterium 38-26]
MPVNNNLKINFNTPVIFDKEVLKNKKPIEKALISIGQVADEYLHMGNKYLKVNATKIESVSIKSPVLKSVFKVFSYILSFGLLPAIASIAKAVYKNWAQKQPLPEQKHLNPLNDQNVENKSKTPDNSSKNDKTDSTSASDTASSVDETKTSTENIESDPRLEGLELNDPETLLQINDSLLQLKENLSTISKKNQQELELLNYLMMLDTNEEIPEISVEKRLECYVAIYKLTQGNQVPLNAEIGRLLNKVLGTQATVKTDEIFDKIKTGRIVITKKMRPKIPFELTGTDQAIGKKIAEISTRDPKTFNQQISKLPVEDRILVNDLKTANQNPSMLGGGKVFARKNSMLFNLVELTKTGFRHVRMKDKDLSKPNPLANSQAWADQSNPPSASGSQNNTFIEKSIDEETSESSNPSFVIRSGSDSSFDYQLAEDPSSDYDSDTVKIKPYDDLEKTDDEDSDEDQSSGKGTFIVK